MQPYVQPVILASFGGLLFGLDTGCIGPVTTMESFTWSFGSISSTVHGLVVSSILIPASLTSFFAGAVADRLGRRQTIALGGLIFAIGTALEAGAANLAMLIVGRCITGVGEGLFLSTIVVYVCEIAPPAHRGPLASIQQQLLTCGLCGGYFICFGTHAGLQDSSASWRIPFAVQSALALAYCLTSWGFIVESPRWLESKGRIELANQTWTRLGGKTRDQEKEEAVPTEQVRTNAPELEALARVPSTRDESSPTPATGWTRIFRKEVLRRTLLGASLMSLQQLVGIDGVLYYAPLLFQQAGLSSSEASFLASGVSALLIMLITIPAFLLADRWGRRTSTLTGGILLAICMFLIGSLYASGSVHSDSGAARWVVIVAIYIFALTYCATWAVGIKVYATEIQPLSTRAPATSFAQSSNWVTNWIVAFTTPILLAKSSYGVYFLFGSAALIAVAICLTAMPETRGKTLEAIDESFHHQDSSDGSNSRRKKLSGFQNLAQGLHRRQSRHQISIELR